MKDWRKLTKHSLIHLVEAMKSDEQIEKDIRTWRREQRRMQGAGRETCRDCRSIAVELGLES